MVEQQQYLPPGLPHHGDLSGHHGLPEDTSSVVSTASGYQDVPFSTVSSFNLPAQCDSSLLTPNSSIASPPLHQARKLARHYPHPPSTPYTQVPTPPGSSKMYTHQWSSQFDVNSQTSQTSSPMNTQASVAPEFYIPDERRTPGPPEPYLGSYGVSESTDTQSLPQQETPYYMNMQLENQNAIILRENHHVPIDTHQRDMERHTPSGALISHSHAIQYRQDPRRPGTENQGHGHYSELSRRSLSDPPRHQHLHRATQGNTRVKKSRPSKRQAASARNSSHVLDPAGEHKNCHGEEVPPRLKSNCPDEERFIFEARWQYRHQRGQDMWDNIQSDYTKRFNKEHNKEMLQMKLKRGRVKYLEWLAEDEKIAREAWKKVEETRYELMLQYFYEMGGSRNMMINPSDIEIKVVNEWKWEEPVYIEVADVPLRRRKRPSPKKRSGGRSESDSIDHMLVIDGHHQHDEEAVMAQVHAARRDWDDDVPTNGDMTDVQMWDNRAPMKIEPGVMLPGDHMLKLHHSTQSSSLQSSQQMGGPGAQPIYQRRKAA